VGCCGGLLVLAFEGENDFELWVSVTGRHPNERGHAIAAETIVDFLHPRARTR